MIRQPYDTLPCDVSNNVTNSLLVELLGLSSEVL